MCHAFQKLHQNRLTLCVMHAKCGSRGFNARFLAREKPRSGSRSFGKFWRFSGPGVRFSRLFFAGGGFSSSARTRCVRSCIVSAPKCAGTCPFMSKSGRGRYRTGGEKIEFLDNRDDSAGDRHVERCAVKSTSRTSIICGRRLKSVAGLGQKVRKIADFWSVKMAAFSAVFGLWRALFPTLFRGR